MKSIRTVPIADDSRYRHLEAEIDMHMARWGFLRKPQKGSTSWLATRVWSPPQSVGETIFKLCYHGPDEMTFGVRRSFAEKVGKLPRITNWPVEFGVIPQTQVNFVGLTATDDPVTVERVHRILKAIGVPKPEYQLKVARPGAEEDLDRQFDDLGI